MTIILTKNPQKNKKRNNISNRAFVYQHIEKIQRSYHSPMPKLQPDSSSIQSTPVVLSLIYIQFLEILNRDHLSLFWCSIKLYHHFIVSRPSCYLLLKTYLRHELNDVVENKTRSQLISQSTGWSASQRNKYSSKQ